MYMTKNEAQNMMKKYGVSSNTMIAVFLSCYVKDYYPLAVKRSKIINECSFPETYKENLNKRMGHYYLENYDIDTAAWFVKYIAANNDIEKDIMEMMSIISCKENFNQIYEWYYEDFNNDIATPLSYSVDNIVDATLTLVVNWIRENEERLNILLKDINIL